MNATSSTVSIWVFAASLIICGEAAAQTPHSYPSKTIRVVVPFAAGGTVDASARVIAEELAKSFRVPVIVDNKAGGGGLQRHLEIDYRYQTSPRHLPQEWRHGSKRSLINFRQAKIAEIHVAGWALIGNGFPSSRKIPGYRAFSQHQSRENSSPVRHSSRDS
jgi:tripartite-type tricarboxylate transporter receptor subunit TctC